MAEAERTSILLKELQHLPTVLDPDQVADVIGVSRRTVDDLIKAGVIHAFALDESKIRKQYRVNKADLIAYITTRTN